MSKVPLSDAPDETVIDYARNILQLDMPEDATRAQALAVISRAGIDADSIKVALPGAKRAAPKAAASPAGEVIEESELEDKFVTIIIPEAEGEQEMVPVSLNGRAMWIRRGQESRIRYPYYAVLREAQRVIYTSDEVKGLTNPRVVPTYPMQIVEMDPAIRRFEAQRTQQAAA